jgi:hypothetical protein
MLASALLATSVAEAAPVASADKGNSRAEAADDLDPATAACAAEAMDRDIQTWTCMGPQLTYETATGAKHMNKKKRKGVVHTGLVKSALRAARAEVVASAVAGDDGWCENGSTCTSRISRYISHTKGNAAYGDGDGVIGTFDANLRTNFAPLADANDYWNQIKGRFEIPDQMDFTLGTLKGATYHCQTGEECYSPNE